MKRGNATHILEMLARGKDSPATPLPAIDFLKGLSMILIWYVHFSWAWHDASWTSLFRFSWYLLDFFGPSMFIVLSVVGNMAGYQATASTGQKPSITRRKAFKASFLFIYGECINVFFLWRLGWFHLSGWNVITTIALFTLLLPNMLRLRARTRLVIVIAIFVCYYPIATWVTGTLMDRGITPSTLQIDAFMDPVVTIYWFFFCQAMMTPLIPWIAVPLLVSVFFEQFIKASAMKQREPVIKELKRLVWIGICLVAVGVGFGLYPMLDFNRGAMDELFAPGSIFTYPFSTGIVAFLVRHVPQYLCYNIGCAAILFSIVTYVHLAMPKLQQTRNAISSFGNLSLTVYMFSHVGLIIPIQLPIEAFFLIFLPLLLITVLIVHAWVIKWKSIGSLEWLMGFYANGAVFGLEYLEKQHRERVAMRAKRKGDADLVPAQVS